MIENGKTSLCRQALTSRRMKQSEMASRNSLKSSFEMVTASPSGSSVSLHSALDNHLSLSSMVAGRPWGYCARCGGAGPEFQPRADRAAEHGAARFSQVRFRSGSGRAYPLASGKVEKLAGRRTTLPTPCFNPQQPCGCPGARTHCQPAGAADTPSRPMQRTTTDTHTTPQFALTYYTKPRRPSAPFTPTTPAGVSSGRDAPQHHFPAIGRSHRPNAKTNTSANTPGRCDQTYRSNQRAKHA